jgi:hypothetical protein
MTNIMALVSVGKPELKASRVSVQPVGVGVKQ